MAAPAFTIINYKAKEQKADEQQANEKKMLDNDKAHSYTALESKYFYDTYASGYEQEGPGHEAEIQIFLREAQLQKGESILDLGCGNGILTLKAKKLVGHGNVAGVDNSEKMLEYARKRSVKGMHFLCGDIEQLYGVAELKTVHLEGVFDVIFARRILHSIHQQKHISLLQHWASFLTPGGRLVVDQVHECRHLAQFRAKETPGFEPFVQRVGHIKSWVQCRVNFHQQIMAAGLKLDRKMIELARDGDDLGPGMLECATKDWKDTGRPGEVPSDPFVELQKRQAYADMEKVMEERNRGWSGLSVTVVAVLAVIKRV